MNHKLAGKKDIYLSIYNERKRLLTILKANTDASSQDSHVFAVIVL